jgi:hypothetical protein
MDSKEKKIINNVFNNGWFHFLFDISRFFPIRVRVQVFPHQDKRFMILLYSSIAQLKDIDIGSALNKGQIIIISTDTIKDIKSIKILGIKGFSFSSGTKTYKFLSKHKQNSDAWVFHLLNPEEPVTFKL